MEYYNELEYGIEQKISVYVKGGYNTPDYYRIHQYLYRTKYLSCHYHQMLSDKMYQRVIPISEKRPKEQFFIFMVIYIRMVLALTHDLFWRPYYIVVLRRITPRKMPFPIKPLLWLNLKLGSKLIWDFDDDILAFKEISLKNFNWFSKIATYISVTHEGLKQLIKPAYREKVRTLVTTDGDGEFLFPNKDFQEARLETLSHEVDLAWTATSMNLPYLEDIMDVLDQAAVQLKQKTGKTLCLKVICNKPLNYPAKNIIIKNFEWSKSEALYQLLTAHIGIMPLIDSKIARGKGGFKLVQYLALGLPAIGTDVGFNSHVIDESCGKLIPCQDKEKWIDAILELSDIDKWKEYSYNAYLKWQKDFPFKTNLAYWQYILNS